MNDTLLSFQGDNAFFRLVFDATLECQWVLTSEGMIHSVNRTALIAAGMTENALQGQPFWQAPWWSASSDTQETVRTAITEARTGITRREVQLRNSDASFTWIELLMKPIHHADGSLYFLMAEGRDISPRKQAFEQLQERELLLAEAQSLAQLGSWTWEASSNEIVWTEGLYRVFGFDDDSKPRTAADYSPRVHPDDREAMSTSLQGIVESDEPIHYSHRVVRPNGEVRHVHGVARRETDPQGKMVRVFGMIQDITAQHLTEAQLTRSIRQLELVSNLAQTVASTLDKQKIYERMVALLRPLIQAAVVVIFEREGDELVVQLADADKEDAEVLKGVRVSIAGTVAGKVWESGQPILLQGKDFEPFVHPNMRQALGYIPRAIIGVPMHWQGEKVGVLQAFHQEATAFDEDDRQLLEIVAVWLAIALINARLLESQKAARKIAELQSERLQILTRRILSAQEDERRRMARELHDEAGQALAVLKMNLSLLRNDIQDPTLKGRLAEIIELTGQTAKNVRLLAHNLRPPALDAFGLAHTLEELCRKFAAHTQIQMAFHADPIPTLATDFNIVCYRFVQEALANIAKHANATHIHVTVRKIGDMLVIEVRDNGQGFDVTQVASGIGFLGMTERLELLDGTLQVQSTPGEGTHLIARVPLTEVELSDR